MSKKILIVDDSATVRQQVGLALTQVGMEVLEAVDGQDGLDRIGQGGIDLVICDVNMPRMGGLEFLKEVRADPKLHSLSVIMLTTSKADRDVMNAYDLNVSSYIVKPVDYHKFVEAVEILDKFWSINQRPDVA